MLGALEKYYDERGDGGCREWPGDGFFVVLGQLIERNKAGNTKIKN